MPSWVITVAIVGVGGLVTFTQLKTHMTDFEVEIRHDVRTITTQMTGFAERLRQAELDNATTNATLMHIEEKIDRIESKLDKLLKPSTQ